MGVDLFQRGVSTVDEVAEVLDGRWLVFNQDEQQVQAQRGQRLPVACLVDRTDVRDALEETKQSC